jgi:hypothetical protein
LAEDVFDFGASVHFVLSPRGRDPKVVSLRGDQSTAQIAIAARPPVLYWLPFARWIVHENNTRVLNHIKRQAESDRTRGN